MGQSLSHQICWQKSSQVHARPPVDVKTSVKSNITPVDILVLFLLLAKDIFTRANCLNSFIYFDSKANNVNYFIPNI